MAYDRQADLPVFRLRFEQYPGLMVRVRRPGLAARTLVEEATLVLRHARVPLGLNELRALRKLSRALAASIVDWDLLNGGRQVEVSTKGLEAQDDEFLLVLAQTWLKAINNTAQPRADRPALATPPATQEAEEPDDELADLPVITDPERVAKLKAVSSA
jgi:hypothetical protein